MPFYVCSNVNCSTRNQVFSLTQAGQKFCPKCNTANSLTAAPTPVVAPTTRVRAIDKSNKMDTPPKNTLSEIDALIAKWDLNIVSLEEAKKTKDYLYTLNGEKSKRIDREGPVTNSTKVVTHGKFRLQFGTKTYAGVWIKVDQILDVEVIKKAFHTSVTEGNYCEVYLG